MKRSKLIFLACVTAVGSACAGNDGTSAQATDESLTGAMNDATGAFNNAIVSVGTMPGGSYRPGCTGTLIGPDVVLTAGHCVQGFLPVRVSNDDAHTPVASGGRLIDQSCVTCATPSPTCTPCNPGNNACSVGTNCITYDTRLIDGRWHQAFADRAPLAIAVGPNSSAPILRRIATGFNQPPPAGSAPHIFDTHADIALIGITGGLLDPSHDIWSSTVAVPRGVATSSPSGLTSSTQLGFIGFSPVNPLRQRAYASGYAPAPGDVREFNFSVFPFAPATSATIDEGDSGGAVLFGGINGNVMGVLQATGGAVGYATSTYFPGIAEDCASPQASTRCAPNLSWWLQVNAHRSFCAASTTPISARRTSTGAADDSHVKLMGLWSDERHENFTTTNGVYNGCYPGWDKVVNPGYTYTYTNLDGWIPRADRAQPAGTVPLFLFWNPTLNDNATLTAALAPGGGYTNVGTLGFIFTSSAPGRVPLFAWHRTMGSEFFTTTHAIDYSSSGYTRVGSASGIGFVMAANQFAQSVP